MYVRIRHKSTAGRAACLGHLDEKGEKAVHNALGSETPTIGFCLDLCMRVRKSLNSQTFSDHNDLSILIYFYVTMLGEKVLKFYRLQTLLYLVV